MRFKSLITIISLFLTLLFFVGCTDDYARVPKDYAGFKLMSTGWEKTDKGKLIIYHAGTVNLNQINNKTKWHNELYLVQVGSHVKKEIFAKENEKQDHRLNLSDGTPLTGDIRFRVKLGRKDTTKFEEILSQVKGSKSDMVTYTYSISLEQVYDHFAKMDNRAGSREILRTFEDFDDYQKRSADSLTGVNARLFRMAYRNFEVNAVPLTLQNVQASNMQRDQTVLAEQNKFAAISLQTAKIDSIAAACRRNGMTYESYYWGQIYKDLAEVGKATNNQIIWNIGVSNMPIAKTK